MNLFIYLLYLFARYFFLPIKLFFLIVFRNLQGVQRILNIASHVTRGLRQL